MSHFVAYILQFTGNHSVQNSPLGGGWGGSLASLRSTGTERHTKLKLGPHMDSRLMYHVYLSWAAGVYLFLYFLNFLSLKFQNIKFFVTLFCEAYKVETWYTHGQRVDLLCTPNTSSHNILVPLFLSFFLALQLAKIKNLHLQNCFNLPLMATAGVCELCSLSAVFLLPFVIRLNKEIIISKCQHEA